MNSKVNIDSDKIDDDVGQTSSTADKDGDAKNNLKMALEEESLQL